MKCLPWNYKFVEACKLQIEIPMEAFMECFEIMHLEGAQPNVITFVSMLTVCGSMQALVNIRIC